jgi:hypothetical protein
MEVEDFAPQDEESEDEGSEDEEEEEEEDGEIVDVDEVSWPARVGAFPIFYPN